jgi:hypothetical protein
MMAAANPPTTAASLLRWNRHAGESVRWAQASGHDLDDASVEMLAKLVAVHAVRERLEGTGYLLAKWERVVEAGEAYSETDAQAVRDYLAPLSPAANSDHREGAVAEYLWHILSIQDDAEAELVRITSPKGYTTAPGGDGLTVRRDGELMFTIWEIKKHLGNNLSGIINGAYGQLSSKGGRYLTELSSVGQLSQDPEEARKFGRLVEAWYGGENYVRVGVAVACVTERRRCFSTMRDSFQHLNAADPCTGLLAVLSDLGTFATRVGQIAWTGL